jgi:quercetin dioxygenase-like cupin family protein
MSFCVFSGVVTAQARHVQIALVKGRVYLLLDTGEAKSLKSGDVVIQRGTNHAWVDAGGAVVAG